LQLPAPPSSYKVGSPAHTKALNNLERAKVFLPLDILPQLPGGSYIREGSIMDDYFSLSGKFKVRANSYELSIVSRVECYFFQHRRKL
jgi:hypothetical protein